MGSIPWIFAGLAAGGILHILCVFGIPWLAEKDAWARLSEHIPANVLAIADRANDTVLPFSSPDVLHAYCLFDLSQRNVVITSPLADGAWSLAVSTRAGENFYVITGADAKKPDIRLLIIPRNRLAQEASTEITEEGDEQNIVVSPTVTGIVAIRAPIRGESFRQQTLDQLRQAHCELQKSFQPIVASAPETPPAEVNPSASSNDERIRRRRRHSY